MIHPQHACAPHCPGSYSSNLSRCLERKSSLTIGQCRLSQKFPTTRPIPAFLKRTLESTGLPACTSIWSRVAVEHPEKTSRGTGRSTPAATVNTLGDTSLHANTQPELSDDLGDLE